jgi:hypothetical protein
MNVYKPLRVALLVYELVRLVILLGLFAVSPTLSQPFDTFPHLLYIVPNALFPLMAFFLAIDLFYYIPYISLYMAGKSIAIVSIVGWSVTTSLPVFLSQSTVASASEALIAGAPLFIALFDALSILGGRMIQKKHKQITSAASDAENVDRGGL